MIALVLAYAREDYANLGAGAGACAFPVLDSHLVTCEGATLEDFRGGGFLPSRNI